MATETSPMARHSRAIPIAQITAALGFLAVLHRAAVTPLRVAISGRVVAGTGRLVTRTLVGRLTQARLGPQNRADKMAGGRSTAEAGRNRADNGPCRVITDPAGASTRS